MLTFAMDEYGLFEKSYDRTKVSPFIGGVLYDDNGEDKDSANERERIVLFYERILESIKQTTRNCPPLKFPRALHVDGKGNDYVVALFKKRFKTSIGEFLVRGTYQGEELLRSKRRGKYYIYANVRSSRGMSGLLGENTSILLKDDYGSNLYYHMVTETIDRVFFHNPKIPCLERININIATRCSPDFPMDSIEADQYRKLGYTERRSLKPNNVYFLTATPDMYRSIFSQKMLESGKHSTEIENFEVVPINYKENKNMEFLYLADSICSVLGRGINNKTDKESIQIIKKIANQINNKGNNIVFSYDAVDYYYKRAWMNYEENNYYDALSTVYDTKNIDNELVAFYMDNWFIQVENHIVTKPKREGLSYAIKKLNDQMRTNKVDQNRALYIFKVLEKAVSNYNTSCIGNIGEEYWFYDAGVSIYCHLGDVQKAIRCYNLCKKYAHLVGIEQYFVTLNKMVVLMLDSFERKKAERIALEGVECQEMLFEIKTTLPVYSDISIAQSVSLGKALSQLAQVYAFNRDEKCISIFRKAMGNFEPDSANFRITQSYLLQYYIDTNNKEQYEREAIIYFGGHEKPEDQLDYILREAFKRDPIFNYKYALYVYVRAIYTFYMDSVSETLAMKLYNIETELQNAEKIEVDVLNRTFKKLTGHPTELIFKYVALILHNIDKENEANEVMNRINHRIAQAGPTVEAISKYAFIEYNEISSAEENENSVRDLYCYLADNFPHALKKVENTNNYSVQRSKLREFFAFMYR